MTKLGILIFMFLSLVISGCGAQLAVEKFNPSLINPMDKTLVFIDNNSNKEWKIELERALRAEGFTFKKFVAIKTIEKVTDATTKEAYLKAEARYGITYGYTMRDYCFGGGGYFNTFIVEVVDLKHNESILRIEKGGYSEGCPPAMGTLFQDLAKALSGAWNNSSL